MTKDKKIILDKAKKIKELADKGVGGERENAKAMLNSFIKKHNLTLEEITGHEYKKSKYNQMSDEQFLKEMAAEFLVLGIGYIFSKLIKQETKYTSGHAFHVFQKKYHDAVNERIKKQK